MGVKSAKTGGGGAISSSPYCYYCEKFSSHNSAWATTAVAPPPTDPRRRRPNTPRLSARLPPHPPDPHPPAHYKPGRGPPNDPGGEGVASGARSRARKHQAHSPLSLSGTRSPPPSPLRSTTRLAQIRAGARSFRLALVVAVSHILPVEAGVSYAEALVPGSPEKRTMPMRRRADAADSSLSILSLPDPG